MKDYIYMKHCPKCNTISVPSNNICLDCDCYLEESKPKSSYNGFTIILLFLLVLIIGLFEFGIFESSLDFLMGDIK